MFDGIPNTYEDGEVIFEQGDAAADMYVIRAGGVRIARTTANGNVTLAELEPDDFFGEMALFEPGARTATAIAVGTTEVEAVDRMTFIEAVGNPVVWEMCRKMCRRIKHMDELLEDASVLDAIDPERDGDGEVFA